MLMQTGLPRPQHPYLEGTHVYEEPNGQARERRQIGFFLLCFGYSKKHTPSQLSRMSKHQPP